MKCEHKPKSSTKHLCRPELHVITVLKCVYHHHITISPVPPSPLPSTKPDSFDYDYLGLIVCMYAQPTGIIIPRHIPLLINKPPSLAPHRSLRLAQSGSRTPHPPTGTRLAMRLESTAGGPFKGKHARKLSHTGISLSQLLAKTMGRPARPADADINGPTHFGSLKLSEKWRTSPMSNANNGWETMVCVCVYRL